ncbi:esterase [Gemmatimonadetes bacterium T265]|nr:esterase [Gemmatimonadetes bacterium T265]
METLHLVDSAARGAVAQTPPFDLDRDTLPEFRSAVLAAYAQLAPPGPTPPEVRTVPGPAGAPGVRVLVYQPAATRPAGAKAPAVLYLHGGGFVVGTPDMMDAFSRALADEHGAVVVAVDYRLAPETPFPGPVEDCYAALTWLVAQADALGVDASRIAVVGHSAGGGLAAALALLARDRGVYALAGQVLIYPMLDARTGTPAAPVDNPTTGNFQWTRPMNRFGWGALGGDAGPDAIPPERRGHYSPALAADVTRLSPAFIAVGSVDLFLEESVAYALRLSRAGVPVELHVYDGGVHGFDLFPGPLREQLAADVRAAMRRMLAT